MVPNKALHTTAARRPFRQAGSAAFMAAACDCQRSAGASLKR